MKGRGNREREGKRREGKGERKRKENLPFPHYLSFTKLPHACFFPYVLFLSLPSLYISFEKFPHAWIFPFHSLPQGKGWVGNPIFLFWKTSQSPHTPFPHTVPRPFPFLCKPLEGNRKMGKGNYLPSIRYIFGYPPGYPQMADNFPYFLGLLIRGISHL